MVTRCTMEANVHKHESVQSLAGPSIKKKNDYCLYTTVSHCKRGKDA